MAAHESPSGMPVVQALQVLIDLRQAGEIVVTNQASARIWPKLSQHPLDFHYNPSTMGGAVPLALGLALALPARPVLVVTGDGSLLMSLGSLVTVAGSGATNLTIVVLDNGMYEVTGGQMTPATGTALDWAALARAAGLASVASFDALAEWQAGAKDSFALPGPRFIALKVQRTPLDYFRGPSSSIVESVAALRRSLTA